QNFLRGFSQLRFGFSVRYQYLPISINKIIRGTLTYHPVHFIGTIPLNDEITGRGIIVLKLRHRLVIDSSAGGDIIRSIGMVNGLTHAGVSVDKFVAEV